MPDLSERLKSALADRYAVESEIGRGGMAVVFLAEDLKHHRKVAIKVLHPDLSASLAARRFLKEIEIAARLDHPHVVALYDSGQADGLLYYVMPYVEGESLRDRLERLGQLPVEEAVQIAAEITDGLSYAHDHGVVHRDVKPANILLSTGHARIADFGIARAIDVAAEDRATATGLAVGTPVYMAPEQATGDGGGDERSDIYAVGCLLYEMLVGEPPYSGLTAQVVQVRKLTESAPKIRSIRDTVEPALEDVVAKALARTPADRYQKARALKSALAMSMTAALGVAPPEEKRWWRFAAIAGGVVVILVLLGYGASTVARGPAAPEDTPEIRSLAVLPLRSFSDDPGQEYIANGMTDGLINELRRLDALEKVPSMTTMVHYLETSQTLPELALELGVDGVMEGSVMWGGDSVWIRLQLLHGTTEKQLWSDAYAGGRDEVLALQNRVVSDVAEGIQLALSPDEQARLGRPAYTPEPQALDAYMKGRLYSNRYNLKDAQLAQGFYEEAIALDSGFALAHAALAEGACAILPGLVEEPFAHLQKCVQTAQKALELDEELSEAHSALALAKNAQWDWTKAEAEFQRAIELDPKAVVAHQWYGWFLAQMMRLDEALLVARRAEELDPLNPFPKSMVVATLMNQHRYDDAHAQLDEVLQMYPDQSLALIYKAAIYNLQEMPEEALEYASRIGEGVPQPLPLKGWSYALGGQDERALEVIAQRDELYGDFAASLNAVIYLALGREDDALNTLERGYRSHATWLPSNTSMPHFDTLRDNPRFQALRRKMGLE